MYSGLVEGNLAHSVRRIIIIIRCTFHLQLARLLLFFILEEIGGAVEMKLLSIPVGVSDFEEIRRNGYYYVDKSCLIGELLGTTGTKVTLITRPRRFGKTLGMSMLESFFDIRKYLTGYLTKAREEDYNGKLADGTVALMIPNAEIKEIFETTVIKWFDDSTKKCNRSALFDAV